MFTEVELIDAINQIEGAKHSIQNCEKLAAIYTVLDHLYPTEPQPRQSFESSYSRENKEVYAVGNSEFIELINGKPVQKAWPLIEELVETVSVLNPRLYSSFMAKLKSL